MLEEQQLPARLQHASQLRQRLRLVLNRAQHERRDDRVEAVRPKRQLFGEGAQLNQLLEHIRQRTGNTVIYRRGTIRRVMRTLQAGQGVAVLIDQHIMSRDAIYVDFFDRPAATTSAVAALALRTGAPVVPVFALPIGGGRYPDDLRASGRAACADADDAVREFTQRCTDVLEMYVRRHPELWLWMHRRWRDDATLAEGVPGMFPSADERRVVADRPVSGACDRTRGPQTPL